MTSAAVISLCCALLGADDPGKTIVRVELIAPRGQQGLASQQWARTFDDLGMKVRIRSQVIGDELEIKEEKRGRLRFVTAIGSLEPDGSIRFPKKKFSQTSTSSLKSWLDGLKVYGAAGTPEAGADWGLTPQGKDLLGNTMGRPATRPATLDALGVAEHLKKLTGLDFRFAEAVANHRFDECSWPAGRLPIGTAAAIAFESVGLGFSPTRLPSGATQLSIDLRDEQSQWPIGWAIPRGTPPALFAKSLFDSMQPSKDPQTLSPYLADVAEKTAVPIVVLRGELDTHRPDWKAIPMPFQSRPSPPIMTLTRVVRAHRMSREYRLDDAGNPFVLIRTQDPRRGTTNVMTPTAAAQMRLRQFAAQF